jgi:hypothetical protein
MGVVRKMGDLMEVLATCDQLQNLAIEFSDDRIKALPTLTLTSIRSLTLHDIPSSRRTAPLPSVRMPALRHLTVGSGPFTYQDLVSLLRDVQMNRDLSLDFRRARVNGSCPNEMLQSYSGLTALSFHDGSLGRGMMDAPLQTLVEYVQRQDSSLSRIFVQGINLDRRRSTMHEWETLEELADQALEDRQNESVELTFEQTV